MSNLAQRDAQEFRAGAHAPGLNAWFGEDGDPRVLHVWWSLVNEPFWKLVHGFAVARHLRYETRQIGAVCAASLEEAKRLAAAYAAGGWAVSRESWKVKQ